MDPPPDFRRPARPCVSQSPPDTRVVVRTDRNPDFPQKWRALYQVQYPGFSITNSVDLKLSRTHENAEDFLSSRTIGGQYKPFPFQFLNRRCSQSMIKYVAGHRFRKRRCLQLLGMRFRASVANVQIFFSQLKIQDLCRVCGLTKMQKSFRQLRSCRKNALSSLQRRICT